LLPAPVGAFPVACREVRPVSIGWVETFNVGVDTGTPVDDADYQVPFPFTGKIHKLTMRLGPEQLTPAERQMIYGTYRSRQ
jgi:arylsulfatase